MDQNLTPAQQKIVDAVLVGLESKIPSNCNPCTFSSTDKKHLHEFADAVSDEGANRETHIIVLRIGVGVQNAVKRLSTIVSWIIVIAVCWAVAMLVSGHWKIPRVF